MKVCDTIVNGVKVLTPILFGDSRGFFSEIYNQQGFHNVGINVNFVQDNISTSVKGVLRGVHTQLKFPQAKIVSCLQGAIFDVAVDCRHNSPSFGKWCGIVLSGDNHKQLFVPEGVAHGFYTLEDAIVLMKVTTHYTPGDEIGFQWNDPSVQIEWPILPDTDIILADKDCNWGTFSDMVMSIKRYR